MYVMLLFPLSLHLFKVYILHLIHNLVYYNVYCRVYVSFFPLFALYRYTTHYTPYFHYTVLTFIFPSTIWHQFRTRDHDGNKNKNDYTLWK